MTIFSLRRMTAFGAVAVLGAGVLTTPAHAAPADHVTIDIAAISDFHGHIENAAALDYQIDELRKANPNTLFVGNGDLVGGSAYVSSIANDQPTLDILNAMKLDLSGAGNHEFDQGVKDFENRIVPASEFPWTLASVGGIDTEKIAPYTAKTVGGVRVAFVSGVTDELNTLVSPTAITGLDIKDPVKAVDAQAALLKDGDESNGEADIVVALMHANNAVAATLGSDVDAVVAGHTHLAVDSVTTPSGAPVLEVGEYGRMYGRYTFVYDAAAKKLVSAQAANIAIDYKNPEVPKSADIDKMYQAAEVKAKELGAQQIGTIEGIANRGTNNGNDTGANRGTESSAGNMIAEAFYQYSQGMEKKADFGIINPGGIRADLDPNGDGIVTLEESYTVQPFGNSYATVDLTEAQIYTMLEQQWNDKEGASRPMLRLGLSYNMHYVFDAAADATPGQRVKAVYINGEKLDREGKKVYTVASNQFILAGGDGFTVLGEGSNYADTGLIDNDVFNAFLKANPGYQIRYNQTSVGITGEDALRAGASAELSFSSLAHTSTEPKGEKVTVYLNGVEVGSAALDTTVTPALDNTGRATVQVVVPADAPADSVLRVVAGPTDVSFQVAVAPAAVTPDPGTPEPTQPSKPEPTQPEQPAKPGAAAGNRFIATNNWNSGAGSIDTGYGRSGEDFIYGDWDGDGVDSLGVVRGNQFLLTNGFSGNATEVFAFGKAGDRVLVGDWNGDGRDTVAVVRGNTIYAVDSLRGGVADHVFTFGRHGDTYLAGDFNGDGRDEVAVQRGNTFFVQDSLGGAASATFSFGRASDIALVGDTDGDGKDTIAVVRGNAYYLAGSLSSGPASAVYSFGKHTDAHLLGDWNGDGVDTPAVRRVR
ncbi:5'-nucleotidase C-terminal domain-containing protein [Actinotignum sanguinis]|uniref:5'-nucleotidase C-terminal domain-containing protein n=2 Tax=Actinomycetaceae TaxID=2049 RepID=A0ABZ0RB73_9ACTO|nr:5'-nucleotidase C-terminal domain-containing protein [Actinotignum sanguinis]WPJ88199.1 5'-nucleotidase C-terminal domain-containing protein [Schaalia turicensis]MDE1552678.1 5'-nucleotidase C-terminal domain-containing protein [Actinotignum sanguinis]MDE1565411.1 5'-nucleotidase C-terminal domain-containing protein [Actinotignum sanguinis]MDE1576405.1 5'-nucleotidase C-terminal domain-containing protein [Actinotignum sanguinis]MDE1642184.1 5'-nucleotidase C-terminal domain-containing prote